MTSQRPTLLALLAVLAGGLLWSATATAAAKRCVELIEDLQPGQVYDVTVTTDAPGKVAGSGSSALLKSVAKAPRVRSSVTSRWTVVRGGAFNRADLAWSQLVTVVGVDEGKGKLKPWYHTRSYTLGGRGVPSAVRRLGVAFEAAVAADGAVSVTGIDAERSPLGRGATVAKARYEQLVAAAMLPRPHTEMACAGDSWRVNRAGGLPEPGQPVYAWKVKRVNGKLATLEFTTDAKAKRAKKKGQKSGWREGIAIFDAERLVFVRLTETVHTPLLTGGTERTETVVEVALQEAADKATTKSR